MPEEVAEKVENKGNEVAAVQAAASATEPDAAPKESLVDALSQIVDPEHDAWPTDDDMGGDEKAAAAEPTEPEALDGDLLRRVSDYGLTAEEARKLGKPDALKAALVLADRLLSRRSQTGKNEPAPAETRQSDDTPAGNPVEDIPELDPSVYDEGLVNAYKAISNRIRAMEAAIQQVHGLAAQTVAQRTVAKFDESIRALGDEYADLLGSGSTDDLDPQSEQYANRMRVARTVKALHDAYAGSGKPPPLESLVRRAVAAEFSEVVEKKASESGARRARNELGQFTVRPNGRADRRTIQSGDEAALSALERKWREIYGRQ